MTHSTTASRVLAVTIATVGLVVGGVATLYLAGVFSISTSTANNIVRAYEVGGWALTIALVAFSGGTAAAMLAVLRRYAGKKSRAALVA
jgi:hypothetical protein